MDAMRDKQDHKKQEASSTTTTAVGFAIKPSPAIASINDVFNQFLPQGHEKLIRNAFFNTVTICCILLVSLTIIAVYFVLQPFLRPLLWSLLAGSVLFPFKYRLTRITRSWLDAVREGEKIITMESASLPVKLFNWIMDEVLAVMRDYCRLLIAIAVTLLTMHLLVYYFTFTHSLLMSIQFMFNVFSSIYTFLQSRSNAAIIATSALVHLLLITFCWNERSKRLLVTVSPFVLVSVACQVISSLGTLGILILGIGTLLACLGIVGSLLGGRSEDDGGDGDAQDETDSRQQAITSLVLSVSSLIWSFIKSLLPLHRFTHYYSNSTDNSFEDSYDVVDESTILSSPSEPKIHELSADEELLSPPAATSFLHHRDSIFPNTTQDSFVDSTNSKPVPRSNVYIYALLWSCCLAYIWTNPAILLLSPIPLAVCGIRWLWSRFCLPQAAAEAMDAVSVWLKDRKDALLHPSLVTLFRLMVSGDKMLADLLYKSADTLCSLSVILMVFVALLLAAAFLTFQIYGESIHLVNVLSNIINSTLTSHPEFNELFFPASDNATTASNVTMFDEMIGNAYLYGRKWLKRTIRSILNAESDENSLSLSSASNASAAIERQLLEVWDRSYQMWLTRDDDSNSHPALIKPKYINTGDYDWNMLIEALKTLNFTYCFNVFKENLDTVMSVAESVWLVLKGNLSLLFSAFWAIFSLLLTGSSAILNGLLNLIVFSTSLFYLLSASEKQYKPIEWASKLIPDQTSSSTPLSRRRNNNKFVKAMNEGINSVFAASFKMTTFYGLYTWLIHTLFQARLVYMPSVTAACLGAVPLIASYWASFPAVLELWLVHGAPCKALLMFLCSILPMCVVDSDMYAEIKGGGHPYLTGLAIAGGIFFLGIEGAIFGPILLCCLFVAGNIYTSIMNEGSGDPVRARVTPGTKHKVFQRINSTIS